MKKGDLVTRFKYNHDVVFEIVEIKGNVAILKGKYVRLCADADVSDLKFSESVYVKQDEFKFDFERGLNLINGCVLHIDGDEIYLNKCMKVYEKYGVPAQGYHMQEEKMPENITNLLIKHKPDILIITGHDNRKLTSEGREIFEHSEAFIKTVKRARVYQPDKDSLVIFAGACQSYYEALIESGANFASSFSRKNVNVLDPVYIAISVAKSHVGSYVDVEKILKNVISKDAGLGGIDTRGVARRLY